MSFFSQQISPEKWGIYNETGLLATVSCQATCSTILANLKSGRRDVPTTELNSLYRVPKLKKRSATTPGARRSSRPPLSTRKTRKLKVGKAKAPTGDSSATKKAMTNTLAQKRQSQTQITEKIAGKSTDGSLANITKAPDLSDLQRKQITMAQATGSAGASQSNKAERA